MNLKEKLQEKTAQACIEIGQQITEMNARAEMRKEAAEHVKNMSEEDLAEFIPEYAYGKGHAAGFEEGKIAGAIAAEKMYHKHYIDKVASVFGEEQAMQLDEHMGAEQEVIQGLMEESKAMAKEKIVEQLVSTMGEEGAAQVLNDPEQAAAIEETCEAIGEQSVAKLIEENPEIGE